ncbi:MAG TPA: GNAT family N-acetyltransferase [Acidimicrobiales bacterium]|nr:GNAT family N-acetyltransferase [Acidimicrobiales bacterium]
MSEVRKATMADIDRLSTALASAFDDDPVFEFLFPQKNRAKTYKAFFGRELAKHYLPHDEAWTTSDRNGAALWAPPGRWRQSNLDTIKSLPSFIRILGASLPRAFRALLEVENAHPPGEHYYLAVLGTEQAAQGKGVGTSVLAPVLEKCDEQGIGAYLESSKEKNIPFYNRHGFEVMRELPLLGGKGPSVWLMWRDPR